MSADTPRSEGLFERFVSDPNNNGDYTLELNPKQTTELFSAIEQIERENNDLRKLLEADRAFAAKAFAQELQSLTEDKARLDYLGLGLGAFDGNGDHPSVGDYLYYWTNDGQLRAQIDAARKANP